MKPIVNHIAVVAILFACLPLLLGADFMEWAPGNFNIVIPNITNRGDAPFASKSLVLYTNGNVHITAINTTAAQLTLDRGKPSNDTLETKYMLTDDGGDGTGDTGGTDQIVYTDYTAFLEGSGYAIIYVPDDNEVTVTLHVKAYNFDSTLADAGLYEATQTLTVSWD
jgi:hypothetical protein